MDSRLTVISSRLIVKISRLKLCFRKRGTFQIRVSSRLTPRSSRLIVVWKQGTEQILMVVFDDQITWFWRYKYTRCVDTNMLGISQVLVSRNTHIERLFEALRVRKDRGRQYHQIDPRRYDRRREIRSQIQSSCGWGGDDGLGDALRVGGWSWGEGESGEG